MFTLFFKEFLEQFHEDISLALQNDGAGLKEVMKNARRQLQKNLGIVKAGETDDRMIMKFLRREAILYRNKLAKDKKEEREGVPKPSNAPVTTSTPVTPVTPVTTVIQVPDSQLTKPESKLTRIAQLECENENIRYTAAWVRGIEFALARDRPVKSSPVIRHGPNIVRIRVPDKALTNPLAIARRRVQSNLARIDKLEESLGITA